MIAAVAKEQNSKKTVVEKDQTKKSPDELWDDGMKIPDWLQTDEEDYLCVCEGTVEAEKNGEKISVFAGEDIHINKTGGELKKLKASKMMLDMAKQTFLEMGYPVK